MSDNDPLSRIAIVLDHPKDIVNIGGVLRVMNNFGLTDLRLVNPDEFNAAFNCQQSLAQNIEPEQLFPFRMPQRPFAQCAARF